MSFRRSEYTAQSFVEMLHRVLGVICSYVDNPVFVVGSSFQHVCGNSEPVSAV